MALNKKSERAELEDTLRTYDYIRMSVADMNGVCRGKVIPGRVAHRFLDGMPLFAGTMAYGCQDEIPQEALKDVEAMGCPNAFVIPDPATLHEVPWAGVGKYRVGQMFGVVHWDETFVPQGACSRHQALKMLGRLDEMGYSILSAMEVEFKLFNKETGEPAFPGLNFGSIPAISYIEDLIFDFESGLHKTGVTIETMHTEYSVGQVEFTIQPEPGIRAADNAFSLKTGIREMALQKGYIANFMTQSALCGNASGMHYNLSLWHKETGINAFYEAGGQDSLSEIARYWIGGMVKHSSALAALCSPTVNCYRRFHQPWAPTKAYWRLGDRMSTFRVKNKGQSGTYIENRLPSSSCNPYMVVAATLAAGIDGIVNKIQPPPQGQSESSADVPHTFKEALDALKADEAIVEALGQEFIDWFTKMKEEVEVAKLGHHNIKVAIEDELEAERKQYEDKI